MPLLTVNVRISDEAKPAIDRVLLFLASPEVGELVGRTAVKAFGANYNKLNAKPNAIGGPRTNYYSDARKSTNYSVSGQTVTVATSQVGIALHYYGGTVEPGKGNSYLTGKPTKYLTIAARPECHGKFASDFKDLVVLWGKNGPYGLGKITKLGIGTTGGKPTTDVYFWLVSKVTLKPDPTTIPSESEIIDPINARLQSAIERAFVDAPDEGGDES